MIVAREIVSKRLYFISRIGAWEYTPRRTSTKPIKLRPSESSVPCLGNELVVAE